MNLRFAVWSIALLVIGCGVPQKRMADYETAKYAASGWPPPGRKFWTVMPCDPAKSKCEVPVTVTLKNGGCDFSALEHYIEFRRDSGNGNQKIHWKINNGSGYPRFKFMKAGPRDDAIEITSGTDFEKDGGEANDGNSRHHKLSSTGSAGGVRFSFYDMWVHYQTAKDADWLPCQRHGPGIFNRE